jgi:thiamine biosynthesis lipoprotein
MSPKVSKGLQPLPQVSDSVRRARPLLGTLVEVQISRRQGDGEAAIEAAFAVVADVHQRMSFHDPDSDVRRLNRGAYHGAVKVAASTYAVLAAAIELHRRSNGLFDIAVADELQRLGLLPDDGEPRGAAVRASTGQIKLLPNGYVRYLHPGVRIDLGGIAKGYAVDCAVRALQAHGVGSGLVNAGGDLRAFGPEPYPVSIRKPDDPSRLMFEAHVRDEALASSGPRFDPMQSAVPRTSALIDPTGALVPCEMAGATVRAASCIVADALTKVTMLAGEQSAAILDHYGASAMLMKADGDVCVSAGWREADCLAA